MRHRRKNYLFLLLVFILTTATQRTQAASPGSILLQPISHQVILNENLHRLLNRVGPNMRASSDYHDYQDMKLNESISAWRILHEQSLSFAKSQVNSLRPQLEETLREAKVSLSCQLSVNKTLDSLEKLDSWSVQMWSSTGSFPPVGLLDGHFTDLGSYRGCVDSSIPKLVDSPRTNSNNNNKSSMTISTNSYATYCSLTFRPIVPSRPRFHMIFEEESPVLVNLFDQNDVFHQLAHHAQYHHYVYLRTGICVPDLCSAQDMQQVAGLIGHRLAMMAGPVKCFSRSHLIEPSLSQNPEDIKVIENRPMQIRIDQPANGKQLISIYLVVGFVALVCLATMWHAFELGLRHCGPKSKRRKSQQREFELGLHSSNGQQTKQADKEATLELTIPKKIAFQYLSAITNGKEFLVTSMRPSEIKCLHGLRVLTMTWIICVHTLQYNDWSQFSRVYENIGALQSLALHPIYNANYVVDNFFFISGMLAAYTTWLSNKGTTYDFNLAVNLLARYLRLTPQVLFVSLLYIILPLLGHGPFWHDMVHYAGKRCEKNWWVNLLHVQSFYRADEMCNLVGWWISIDMFYYVLALVVIYIILSNHIKGALATTTLIVVGCGSMSVYKHFTGGYTPNNLGTVPQVAEVWTDYVVDFFWSPYTHAYSFFLGLWVGYIVANKKWQQQVVEWSRSGWIIAAVSLLTVNLSSHIWMSGAVGIGNQYLMTAYNITCSIIWSTAFAWLVVSCHYGCLQRMNSILSIKLFVMLSKASFIIYLSHMLVVRTYWGIQNHLIEISMLNITYAIVGNTITSTALGVFLCITFEGPTMKLQKLIIQSLRPKKRSQKNYAGQLDPEGLSERKLSSNFGPTSVVLLK